MAQEEQARILRDYQRRALAYLLRHRSGALFVEMRLGKSLVIMRRLKLIRPVNPVLGLRALVVAPGSALSGWKREAEQEGFLMSDLTGARKKREVELDRIFLEGDGRPMLALINKEGWLALREISTKPWDAVVVDESHFIKNPRAKVTKFFLRNFRLVPHRYVLTGTPNPEGEDNYFCQLAFLDGQAFGAKDYWHFRNHYMHPSYAGFGWELKPGMPTILRREVGRRAFILRRKDVGLREQKVYETRTLEMPSKLRASYREMAVRMLASYGGEQVRTMWAGAQWQALRQMTSGIFNDAVVWMGKYDEVMDLLGGELARQQVVVWCCYTAEVRAMSIRLERAKIKAASLTGQDSLQERSEAVDRFQRGRVRALVLQQAIAQTGMDLSAADAAIYLSCPPSQVARVQTEDRILTVSKARRGTPLLYIDLAVSDSVDEDVLELIRQKKKLSDHSLQRAIVMATKERIRIWKSQGCST